jgi:DNA-binding NarL/FixJ family response regulator
MRALTIVVADDHPLFRAGIVRALDQDPRFVVVGEAADGPTAERMILERAPALALIDLRMPGRDGLELLARLRHHEPPVAIVVLTSYAEATLVHSAMDAGAAAYRRRDRGGRGGACSNAARRELRRSATDPAGALAARRRRLRLHRPPQRPCEHHGGEHEHPDPRPEVDVDAGRLVLDVLRAEQPEREQDAPVDREHGGDDAADVEAVRRACRGKLVVVADAGGRGHDGHVERLTVGDLGHGRFSSLR